MRKGMYLTDTQFWALSAWFVVLAVGSAWLWASLVLGNRLTEPLSYAAIVGKTSYTALCISSVYYIRKLYKDKFAIDLDTSRGKTSSAPTVLYFATRPLFAILAALFFNLTLCEIIQSSVMNFAGFSKSFFIHLSAAASLVSVVTGGSIRRMENLAS